MNSLTLTPQQQSILTRLNIQNAAHLAAILQLKDARMSFMEELGLDNEGLEQLCNELEAAGHPTTITEPEEWPDTGCLDDPSMPPDTSDSNKQ